MHLFVYYDVRREQVDAVRPCVRAVQEHLGLGRLMRRPDGDDGASTWMEIYEDVDDAFESRLAASVERAGLVGLTGPRHTERFVEAD